jgi:protein arginine N-methyltransferase 5
LPLARQDGFDYVTTALPDEHNHARADVAALESKWWHTSVVGVASAASATLPNNGPATDTFQKSLAAQLQWAWHMSLPAIILPALSLIYNSHATGHGLSLEDYAQAIYKQVLAAPNHRCQLWIPVRLDTTEINLFQRLTALCDYSPAISMMLIMEATPTNQTLITAEQTQHELQLLHVATGCAVISCVALPCNMFLTNKRGYPTLSKHHQYLFKRGILQRTGRTVRWVLQGPTAHPLLHETQDKRGATGCLPYLQYLQHMRQRPEVKQYLDTPSASLERDYLDHLQRPLQPLKDHLENSTYETFEKDPVKYQEYETAIKMALQDRSDKAEVTVVVVGAGRGPLVTCALRAYQQLDAQERPAVLHVYAVEKNPSAVIYLRSLASFNDMWKAAAVTVVHTDLRYITPDQLGGRTADIVVSELLGSFGCNELSPECLDGMYSTPVWGNETISIPVRCTSHLAPVASVKLHCQAKQQGLFPSDKLGTDSVGGLQQAMETPYVVRTHAASQMHPEQDCWDFVHPPAHADKNRSKHMDFAPDPTYGVAYGNGYGAVDPTLVNTDTAPHETEAPSWTLTGFLGTFTADLYYRQGSNEVCQYSTAPSTFSTGMFSWFPLYFPLHQPIQVPANASVKVDVWRRTDETRVWYEWSASVHRQGEVLSTTPIHNPDGRSSFVSM